MKIGLAVGYFDPQVGGSEEVVKRLAIGLTKRGHDVIVATSHDRGRRPCDMVCPVTEFHLSGTSARSITGDASAYEDFLLMTDRDLWLFYAAQIWSTDLALPLLSRIPSRTVVVPCGYSGLHNPDMRAYFDALPAYLSTADALVYMSPNYQDYQHDLACGLGDTAVIIPNGAGDDEFNDPPSHPSARDLTVLCVANHIAPKGHRRAIEAFQASAARRDRLVIIGRSVSWDPRTSCALRCTAASVLDRRVHLKMRATRSEVVREYRSADVFLFASYVEAAPLVIIEAMAAGIPFVSTPVGNVRDYSDSGIIVEADGLSGALAELLGDENRRRALGNHGRKRWERFHRWSLIVDAYEHLFMELCG